MEKKPGETAMKRSGLWLWVCLMSLSGWSLAFEEGANYLQMKPAFLVNLNMDTKRLSFLKLDVSLRVDGAELAEKVEYHMPLLRDALVVLFSQQRPTDIDTVSGKESLRKQALARVQAEMVKEEGQACVQDVLFTSFIIQQ
jgi:flagellar FliL protein